MWAIWRSVWSLKCSGDAPPMGSSWLGVASRTAAGTSFDQGKACAVAGSVWAGWSSLAAAGAAQVAIQVWAGEATWAMAGVPPSSSPATIKTRKVITRFSPRYCLAEGLQPVGLNATRNGIIESLIRTAEQPSR
jgi:hypothetical protein